MGEIVRRVEWMKKREEILLIHQILLIFKLAVALW